MPELIDKTAAYNALKHEAETHDLSFTKEAYDRAARIIDQMPTIDPEVQLAHWITGKRGKWKCSCCGNEIYCTAAADLQRNHEFCGHCGAEMKDQCDIRTLIEEAIL